MTILDLPTPNQIDAAATQIIGATHLILKAQWHLHRGIELVAVAGGVLVPSSKGDAVYRVASDGSCSCPARGECYHQFIVQIVEQAHAMPTMPRLTRVATRIAIDPAPAQVEETLGERLAAARKATALVNDLFA